MNALEFGEDSRKNWRSINQLAAELEAARQRISALEHPNTRRVITGAGGAIRMYQLMSEDNDWNVCRTLSIDKAGVRTVVGTDLYIAKPAELRHTIVAELIDGDSLTYHYTDPEDDEHTRTAFIDEGEATEIEEVQVISPYYLPADADNDGSIIYAYETAGTGVWREVSTDVFEQLTLLEISGRQWARSSTQPAP